MILWVSRDVNRSRVFECRGNIHQQVVAVTWLLWGNTRTAATWTVLAQGSGSSRVPEAPGAQETRLPPRNCPTRRSLVTPLSDLHPALGPHIPSNAPNQHTEVSAGLKLFAYNVCDQCFYNRFTQLWALPTIHSEQGNG